MPIPLAAVAIGTGLVAGGVGSLWGATKGPDVPDWLDTMLEDYANQEDYIGYTPDPSKFDTSLRAQLSQIQTDMGYNQEAFRANAASRGVYSGGESLKEEYRNVNLPAIQAGNVAATGAALGYEQLSANVGIANAQARQSAIAMLLQRWMATQKGGNVADAIGDIGGSAVNYAMLTKILGGGG